MTAVCPPLVTDGYTDIPAGHIAAIATTLEMLAPPPSREMRVDPCVALRRVERPGLDWYRTLFRRIGEPWLWHSRLRLSDEALARIIHHESVEIWALSALPPDAPRSATGVATSGLGTDEGLLELDFRDAGACELAFFGLTLPWTGRGAGRTLMTHAVSRAWSRPIERFWVHTCTLDHPSALGFYIRSGFVPVKRQLEVAPDPRLDGTLPPDAAPGVPIIR